MRIGDWSSDVCSSDLDIPVHVYIAGTYAFGHARNCFIQPGMNPESQAVAGGVYSVDQRVQILALVAHDMQYRAEHLFFQGGNIVQLDEGGRNKRTVGALCTQLDLVYLLAGVTTCLDLRLA